MSKLADQKNAAAMCFKQMGLLRRIEQLGSIETFSFILHRYGDTFQIEPGLDMDLLLFRVAVAVDDGVDQRFIQGEAQAEARIFIVPQLVGLLENFPFHRIDVLDFAGDAKV